MDLSWISQPLSPFDIICQMETTNLCCLVVNLLGKITTIYEITRLIKYSANCLSPLAIHLVEMKTKTTQHEISWPLGEILISLCFEGLFSMLSHECSKSFYCLLTCLLVLSDNRQHCQRRSRGQLITLVICSKTVHVQDNHTARFVLADVTWIELFLFSFFLSFSLSFFLGARRKDVPDLKAIKWDFCLITIVFFSH